MQISEISNIRYAPLSEYPDGGYLFDFRGQVCRIAEKDSVPMLSNNEASARWIAQNYAFLLEVIPETAEII